MGTGVWPQGATDNPRNGSPAMVGPVRSWPPPADGYVVPFLHCVRDAVMMDQRSRRVDGRVRNSALE
jgi:hypothetical protein